MLIISIALFVFVLLIWKSAAEQKPISKETIAHWKKEVEHRKSMTGTLPTERDEEINRGRMMVIQSLIVSSNNNA